MGCLPFEVGDFSSPEFRLSIFMPPIVADAGSGSEATTSFSSHGSKRDVPSENLGVPPSEDRGVPHAEDRGVPPSEARGVPSGDSKRAVPPEDRGVPGLECRPLDSFISIINLGICKAPGLLTSWWGRCQCYYT